MRIFDISADVKVTVNGNERKVFFSSPYAPAYDLHKKKILSFERYFPIYNDPTSPVYTSCKFICFNIERNFLDEKQFTRFSFPESVNLQSGITLNLQSIIIHNGRDTENGHYTCVIRKKNEWYMYDDMKTDIQRIASNFLEVMKNNYILENCTTLVYHT